MSEILGACAGDGTGGSFGLIGLCLLVVMQLVARLVF